MGSGCSHTGGAARYIAAGDSVVDGDPCPPSVNPENTRVTSKGDLKIVVNGTLVPSLGKLGKSTSNRRPMGVNAVIVEDSFATRPSPLSPHGGSLKKETCSVDPDGTITSLKDSTTLTSLERGGVVVQSSVGGIQFGIPPETIKDSMRQLKGKVPQYFVIPDHFFDRTRCMSIAEFEFPTYFNFFILKKKVTLITNHCVEQRIRAVFQETVLGPESHDITLDMHHNLPREDWPNLIREGRGISDNPVNPSEPVSIDAMVNFSFFEEACAIFGPENEIEIYDQTNCYTVYDNKVLIAVVGEIPLPDIPRCVLASTFRPPMFGVTLLGSSHGFDPDGGTTGMVFWMNRRGVMVDPPPNSSYVLARNGIPSKLIDAVVLTHNHSDHDAGTLQKFLMEDRVILMTTQTIFDCFVRKYMAITELERALLTRFFTFEKVLIGKPVYVNGGSLRFFYALHTIPCLGVEASFGGKRIVYSGDTLYSPTTLSSLLLQGKLGQRRYEQLLNFPFDADIILHEAGVPPIHTPISVLQALPEDVKTRLYMVHVAEKSVPPDIKYAKSGVENTLTIDDVKVPLTCSTLDVLAVIGSTEMFRELALQRATHLVNVARMRAFPAGSCVVEYGTPGDYFFAIVHGLVGVYVNDSCVKTYTSCDYFGETSLISNAPRNATITALSDTEMLVIEKTDFLHLIEGTEIQKRMQNLAKMRDTSLWQTLGSNTVLSSTTSNQKTHLESIAAVHSYDEHSTIWKPGKPMNFVALVMEGSVRLSQTVDGRKLVGNYHEGSFVGDVALLFDSAPKHNTLLETTTRTSIFVFENQSMRTFLQHNPGILLALLGKVVLV